MNHCQPLLVSMMQSQFNHFKVHHVISDGDVQQGLKDSDIVLEGEMRAGGQEHFYLECNAALVIPGEGDELFIYCSTQNPTKTQNFAAYACGIQASKVVCKMKRMGGGFWERNKKCFHQFICCISCVQIK